MQEGHLLTQERYFSQRTNLPLECVHLDKKCIGFISLFFRSSVIFSICGVIGVVITDFVGWLIVVLQVHSHIINKTKHL